MRGGPRSNKPAAMRELQGSRKRPNHRPDVPATSVATLEPPPGLTALEREYWTYYEPLLAGSKVLTAQDRETFAHFTVACAQIRDIRQQQQAPEYRRLVLSVTVDGAGNEHVKATTNPLDAQLRNWITIARLAGAELGLSPVSRARVAPIGSSTEVDELEAYIRQAGIRRVK